MSVSDSFGTQYAKTLEFVALEHA